MDDAEQLALLDVEPSIADQVGAEPLRAPEPTVEPAASVNAVLERAQTTLAEARRQAEAFERQRVTREAAAAERAAQAEAHARADAERAAEADRARRDEVELERHDQPRRELRAERGRGVDDEDALGIGF